MAENGFMSDFFARDEPSFRHRRIRRIRRIWLSCPNPGRQRPSWKCRSRRRHRRCFEMLWIGSSSRILQKSFRSFFFKSCSRVFHLLRPVFHLFSFSLRQLGLTCRIPSYATPRPRNWRLARSSRRSTARLDTDTLKNMFECRWVRCVEASLTQTLFLCSWLVVDLLTLCICGIWFKCRTWCYNRCKLSRIFIWASFQIPLWRHKVACNIRSHKPSQTSPFHTFPLAACLSCFTFSSSSNHNIQEIGFRSAPSEKSSEALRALFENVWSLDVLRHLFYPILSILVSFRDSRKRPSLKYFARVSTIHFGLPGIISSSLLSHLDEKYKIVYWTYDVTYMNHMNDCECIIWINMKISHIWDIHIIRYISFMRVWWLYINGIVQVTSSTGDARSCAVQDPSSPFEAWRWMWYSRSFGWIVVLVAC